MKVYSSQFIFWFDLISYMEEITYVHNNNHHVQLAQIFTISSMQPQSPVHIIEHLLYLSTNQNERS